MQKVDLNQIGLIAGFSILIVLLVSIGVVLLLTVVFWLPLVLVNIPVIIIFGILAKYTIVGKPIKAVYYYMYDWVFYKSETPRRLLWQQLYDSLCWLYPQTRWKVMNYGFALLNDDGKLITNLKADDEEERFCLQLYHYIATSFNTVKTLKDLTILEVGSGRGGGLNYISTYLSPKRCIGVDFSENQIKFCNTTYLSNDKISFIKGDSEKLSDIPELSEEFADMVINVESSHCYGNFKEFVRQVDRVLKPGGFFIFTDFREIQEIEPMEAALKSFSLEITKKEDITINVIHALKLDEKRRVALIENNVYWFLRPFFKKFSGLQGSRINDSMMRRKTLYMAYVLRKKGLF